MRRFLIAALLLLVTSAAKAQTPYVNPVIKHNCPDPSVIDDRARTGYFYAYSTQSVVPGNGHAVMPVYRSKDMVNWEFVCDGFAGKSPAWRPEGRLWAPDINYVDGRYVLYYAMGVWGDLVKSSSGVAVSDSPTGPFEDKGMIVSFDNTGVLNCIDPFFIEDGGKKYLFWGSLGRGSGIWAAELSDDGLSLREGAELNYIGGTNMEGTYIFKRDGWFYIFTSQGTCCNGAESTYHVLVARSRDIFGPYMSPDGEYLIYNKYHHTMLSKSPDAMFVGTGHNSEILVDDAGRTWMYYHAFWRENDYHGRCMLLDEILWGPDGWPYIEGGRPSLEGDGPVVK